MGEIVSEGDRSRRYANGSLLQPIRIKLPCSPSMCLVHDCRKILSVWGLTSS